MASLSSSGGIYIYLLLIFRRGHDATSTHGEGKYGEMKRSVRVKMRRKDGIEKWKGFFGLISRNLCYLEWKVFFSTS